MTDRLVLYPGSFDPVTLGHLDILARACGLFDRVCVLAAASGKPGMWPVERRVALIEQSLGDLRCEVDSFEGLLVDEVRRRGAVAVVRGVRSAGDYEHEWNLHGVNRRMLGGFETVWLPARPEYAAVSSTLVRDVARHRGPLTDLVPPPVVAAYEAQWSG